MTANVLLWAGLLCFGILLAECCYQIELWWERRRNKFAGVEWNRADSKERVPAIHESIHALHERVRDWREGR